MGQIWMPGGGGGGVTSDEVTVTKADIPASKKALTADSNDEVVNGILKEYDNSVGCSGAEVDSTAKNLLLKVPGRGIFSAAAKIAIDFTNLAKLIELTAAKIANNQKILDITGTYKGRGNATADKVLTGSTFSTASLDNEPGKMKHLTNDATITHEATNTTKVILGDAAFSAKNSDGKTRAEIRYNGTAGYITPNTLFAVDATAMASAGGLTAAKLLQGQSAFTLAGTATSDANAIAAALRTGYTAYAKGAKITGALAIQSAINFSAAAQSDTVIRISWKNPAKGPYQGVQIRMSTSGYPGVSGGTLKYTGTGSSTAAGGTSYVDITGLSPSTLYYFTCYTYVTNLGTGSSHNLSATTQMIHLNKVFDTANTLYARYGYYSWEEDSEGDSYFDGYRLAQVFYAEKNTLKITAPASHRLPASDWAYPSRNDKVVYSFKYSPTGSVAGKPATALSDATLNALKKYTKYTLTAHDGQSNTSWVYETTGSITNITVSDYTGPMRPGGIYGEGYWINIYLDKTYIETRSDLRVWSLTLS